MEHGSSFGDSPIQAQIAIPMEHAPNYVAPQNLVWEARRGIVASPPSGTVAGCFYSECTAMPISTVGKAALLDRYLAAQCDGNLAILWSPSFLGIAMPDGQATSWSGSA
jgi:hypothetical protein